MNIEKERLEYLFRLGEMLSNNKGNYHEEFSWVTNEIMSKLKKGTEDNSRLTWETMLQYQELFNKSLHDGGKHVLKKILSVYKNKNKHSVIYHNRAQGMTTVLLTLMSIKKDIYYMVHNNTVANMFRKEFGNIFSINVMNRILTPDDFRGRFSNDKTIFVEQFDNNDIVREIKNNVPFDTHIVEIRDSGVHEKLFRAVGKYSRTVSDLYLELANKNLPFISDVWNSFKDNDNAIGLYVGTVKKSEYWGKTLDDSKFEVNLIKSKREPYFEISKYGIKSNVATFTSGNDKTTATIEQKGE